MKRSIIGCLMAATAIVPAAALAQPTTEDGVEDSNVIIVTARKKEESLQSVPVTVSAFSEDFLDEANVGDLEELSDFTPGFQLQSAFGRDADRPVIRGASNILLAEGKVGYFIDGVPFVGSSTALDLENFSRVEVIKGPQSAIFGRGTLSGAVNYVSQPGTDVFGFMGEATIATHNEYEVFGRVAAPLTDGVSGFVSAKYYTFGGDFTETTTGQDLGEETLSLATGLNFQSDNFEASITYMYTKDDDDHYPITLQGSALNNVFLSSRGYFQGVVQSPDSVTLNFDQLINPGVEREAHRIIATATADLGGSGYTATALFGYTNLDQTTGTDQTYDGTNALFFPGFCQFIFGPDCVNFVSAFNSDNQRKREAISAEIRFASPQEDRFRWQVGGFFFDDTRRSTDYGRKRTEFGYGTVSETDVVSNFAVFGGVEFDVTDRLTVGAELRHANDKIGTRPGASYRLGDLFPGATNPDRIIAGDGAVRNGSFKSTLPRFTIDYQASDDTLVYAVYSEGNTPGGFNGVDAPTTTFGEERLKNYEIGVKSQPIDGLRINLAGFFIDYSDQVLTSNFVTGVGGIDSFSDNIGDTEIKGIEMDGSWQVNDFLTFSASYAYIDAEVKNGFSTDQALLLGGSTGTATLPDGSPQLSRGAVATTGCDNLLITLDAGSTLGDGSTLATATPCSVFGDVSGQTPPLVSKHQATFSTALDVPLGDSDWSFFARGDLIYRSSFFAQIHNLAETGNSTKVNFAAGIKSGNITIRAWVKNAFQDDTPRGILRYVDFSAPQANGQRQRAFAVTPPERRQFGLTVSGSF